MVACQTNTPMPAASAARSQRVLASSSSRRCAICARIVRVTNQMLPLASSTASNRIAPTSRYSVSRDDWPRDAEKCFSTCISSALRRSSASRSESVRRSAAAPGGRAQMRSPSTRICSISSSPRRQAVTGSRSSGSEPKYRYRWIIPYRSSGWFPPCRKPTRAAARSGGDCSSASRAARSPSGTASQTGRGWHAAAWRAVRRSRRWAAVWLRALDQRLSPPT